MRQAKTRTLTPFGGSPIGSFRSDGTSAYSPRGPSSVQSQAGHRIEIPRWRRRRENARSSVVSSGSITCTVQPPGKFGCKSHRFRSRFRSIPGSSLTSDPETARLIHQSLLGDAWENAREAVVVFDDARNFVAFNTAYCDLTGYGREEILELRVGGRLVTDPASHEVFEQALAIGGGAVGRARLTRKDGSVIEVGYRLIETNVSTLPFTIALVWPEI